MIYQLYAERIQKSKLEIARLNRLINQNSLSRLLVILGGGALLFYSFQTNSIPFVFAVFIAIILIFAFLINRQSKLEGKRDAEAAFLKVNENELTLKSERNSAYDAGLSFADDSHPYTADLDIFGEKSLFVLLNRAATVLGIATLAHWLSQPATKAEIEERQRASAEITEDLDWSQRFQARMVFNLSQKLDAKAFLTQYFSGAGFAFGNRFMRLYVPAAPFILLVGILVSLFVTPIWNVVIGFAVFHLCWALSQAGKVAAFSNKIDRVGNILSAYAEGLAVVEAKEFKAARNLALQQKLYTKDKPFSRILRELGGLINNLDARNNMLMGPILNIIFLWDFKYVTKIADWKKVYGDDILLAFDVIAELEVLNSLAILKRNHPDWVTPQILANPLSDKIEAKALSHPLIRSASAVANDYSNDQHLIALITGSNMAGKSTFLRTVGVNAALAYAGAVVCAAVYKLPIYNLISYMRIRDSLNESTSTFKAELDRMKFILETVAKDPHSFFLIDEMLRGTNSVDKYLGSRAIIRKLIAQSGKGMVATHDLQLATLEEENRGKIQNYHFDIQVREGEMLFDYKLKDGQCTVFNASMLLKGIGVDVDQA